MNLSKSLPTFKNLASNPPGGDLNAKTAVGLIKPPKSSSIATPLMKSTAKRGLARDFQGPTTRKCPVALKIRNGGLRTIKPGQIGETNEMLTDSKSPQLPTLATIAQALGGEISGGQILAPGPSHDPKDRSLSVKVAPNARDGFIVHSFSGDDPMQCRDYVRSRLETLQIDNRPTDDDEADFVYRDARGAPYLRVQRRAGKKFSQLLWNGRTWVAGKPKGPKIPYRLPELLATKIAPIFIVEGEKDADRLASLGLVATTCSEGAGKWTPDLNHWFEGRMVYIIADNDEVGRKHAQTIARNLSAVAESARVVQLEGLPPKGDASDWLNADLGRSAKLLLEIAAKSSVWTEPKPVSGGDPSIHDMLTEDTVAQHFAERYRNCLRYCHDTTSWFKWTGNRWERERTGLAFNSVRILARELSRAQPDRVRHGASKSSFARAVERYAIYDPAFAVTAASWDADAFLLGTPGGTVNLRTGQLRPSDPAESITKITSVTPAKEADCPRWLTFLAEATGHDVELIRFLQRWCGYCLTGDTREHALVFMYGPGGNGKGVFLNTVVKILEDYAATAPMETFTASKFDRHPTELAMLHGARLATASETEEGRGWAESRIKQLTGGDLISARFLYRDHFTYRPQFKLFLVGNHKPQLRNVDDAARRRFRIVPFVCKPAEPDPQLEAKLYAEAAGILRWMIQGCLEWQEKGLQISATVRRATDAYFVDQDLLGQWLRERCDARPCNSTKRETTAALYASWKMFAEPAGEPAGSMKSFSEQLARKGFPQYRTATERGYVGITIGRRTFRILPPPLKLGPLPDLT